MRRFRITDCPDDGPFVLLDLPLRFDFTEDEFDKIADMKPNDELTAAGITIKRIQ